MTGGPGGGGGSVGGHPFTVKSFKGFADTAAAVPDCPEDEEVVVAVALARGGWTKTAPRGRTFRSPLAGPTQSSEGSELSLTSAIEYMDGVEWNGLAWLGLALCGGAAACSPGTRQGIGRRVSSL